MIKIISTLIILASINFAQPFKVKTGLDKIIENNFDILNGKKIGLVTNPTGVNQNLQSNIDIFYEASNVELIALYGPEHGVRGDHPAGDYVSFYKDEKTGIPVYSLYGPTRKPTDEMLEGLDAIVYDIQDNGSRSYTYISTLGLVMEAASKNNIEVIVLDRPNPLGGNRIEGNLVEDGYYSFVSQFKIPYIYGLTVGELAEMLNEEGLLEGSVKCKLTVVPMEGWKRNMTFEDTGLEWVPTSPHIPHKNSSFYYSASGILGELQVFSIGVGYTLPFQLFAAKWIDAKNLSVKMNELNLPGVIFRPITFKQFYSVNQGEFLHGVQIHIIDFNKVELLPIQFYFMQVHNQLYPDKKVFEMAARNRLAMFDKVAGTDRIRKEFSENYNFEDIRDYLNKDVDTFRELSQKYYLYD